MGSPSLTSLVFHSYLPDCTQGTGQTHYNNNEQQHFRGDAKWDLIKMCTLYPVEGNYLIAARTQQ